MSKIAPTPWDRAVLVDVVARYCQRGLVAGEAVVVIASPHLGDAVRAVAAEHYAGAQR